MKEKQKIIIAVVVSLLILILAIVISVRYKNDTKEKTNKKFTSTTKNITQTENKTTTDFDVPQIGKNIELTTSVSDKDKPEEIILFNLINAYRKENEISPLQTDKNLNAIANARINEVKKGFFDLRPNGLGFHTILDENAYPYSNADEVIFESNGKVKAEKIAKIWYDDPEKAEILLHPEYKQIAISVTEYNGKTYAVAIVLR